MQVQAKLRFRRAAVRPPARMPMNAKSKRIECAAAAWLARRDAGGWSAHDQAQLDAWLDQSDAHRVAWLRLVSAWEQADRLKALGAGVPPGQVPPRGQWTLSAHFDARQALTRQRDSLRGRFAKTRRASRVFAAVALVLLAVLAGGSLWLWQNAEPPPKPLVYKTGVGSSNDVRLADGSEATLSSDTTIAVRFSRKQRDLDLRQGEAFFEVRKDAARPFVVHVDGRRVIAVGTRFAVRRDGDAGLRVVVTQGLVRLESAPDSDAATLLPPGSVARLSGDSLEVRHLPVEQARELLSWREGFVVFHDTPMGAAVQEFNRYNARKLVIGDPAIAGLRVGGHFRWSNEDAFVRLIEQVFPVRSETRDGEIVLLHRKPDTHAH